MGKDKAIPILGISRHRLKTDGEGVTTFIAFYGCPLHCKYCINPQCHITEGAKEKLSPINTSLNFMLHQQRIQIFHSLPHDLIACSGYSLTRH